jgi:hypothetical protein
LKNEEVDRTDKYTTTLSIFTMNDQSKNNAADKYRIFEDWLRVNGAEFSLVSMNSNLQTTLHREGSIIMCI